MIRITHSYPLNRARFAVDSAGVVTDRQKELLDYHREQLLALTTNYPIASPGPCVAFPYDRSLKGR